MGGGGEREGGGGEQPVRRGQRRGRGRGRGGRRPCGQLGAPADTHLCLSSFALRAGSRQVTVGLHFLANKKGRESCRVGGGGGGATLPCSQSFALTPPAPAHRSCNKADQPGPSNKTENKPTRRPTAPASRPVGGVDALHTAGCRSAASCHVGKGGIMGVVVIRPDFPIAESHSGYFFSSPPSINQ